MKIKLALFVVPFIAWANSAVAETCVDLKTCAKVMFDLKGQRYIWETDAEKKVSVSPSIELTQENADVVFTALLDQSFLARTPVGDGKTFRIVPGALLKELEVPIVDASAEQKPKFGNTWDWVQMRYKPKARELTTSIEASYRLHVPREARLQADYGAGLLIVTASTPVVRQMYEVIKATDVPQSAEVKSYLKAEEKKWDERRKESNKK